jgi:hypothetical protein
MMDRVVRLARWFGSQVGQIVPEGLGVCEFECRETTCTWADWRECRRRREMRPGGADPRRRSGDKTGLNLGVRSGVPVMPRITASAPRSGCPGNERADPAAAARRRRRLGSTESSRRSSMRQKRAASG